MVAEIEGGNVMGADVEVQTVNLISGMEERIVGAFSIDNILLLIMILITVAATVIVAKVVKKFLFQYFRRTASKLKVDETIYLMIGKLVVAFVYIAGIIIIISMIPQLGNFTLALLAGAGFTGLVIGLAAQSTLSNIITGISLAVFRPFHVGDNITIQNEYGIVEDITLRHTVIRTWDYRRLIIPNSILSDETIINFSIIDPRIVGRVDMGISYDSDIDLARAIMVDEARKHPEVIEKPEEDKTIRCFVTECGDFAVNMRLYIWIRDRSILYQVVFELTETIKKRFDREGVEIPFPYRTLVYKKEIRHPKRFDPELFMPEAEPPPTAFSDRQEDSRRTWRRRRPRE